MAVSVIGLGKLGLPIAATIAARGARVVGADLDAERVEAVSALRAPFFEPGLEEQLRRAGRSLTATTSIEQAVLATDLTMLLVPTPTEEGGGFSLASLLSACDMVGRALREKDGYHVVSVTSTVMPGATAGPLRQAIEAASGRRVGEDLGLCYSPEFVALGTVIRDFLEPDFLLVGESDARAGDALCALYSAICENDPPVARMGFVNAELAKLAVNSFVTTKISFANMLARICEKLPGADVDAVTSALGLDSRIGSRYLRGAISYGGPCFPRDNEALVALAREVGAPGDLAEATDQFNRSDLARLRDRILAYAEPGSTVAILGLAYKPGTGVVEESPGLLVAAELAGSGVDVVVFDPAGLESAAAALAASGVRLDATLEGCVSGSTVVVIATPWEEFRELPAVIARSQRPPDVVLDCWRLLSPDELVGPVYVAFGAGPLPAVQAVSV